MKLNFFIAIFFLSNTIISHSSNNVVLNFSNIKNNKGYLRIGLYKDDFSFKKKNPFSTKSFKKENIIDGKLSFNMNLKSGIYGIAFLDDENENGEMDYSFFIPQEGFGFSNYIHSGLQRPDFDEFKFIVSKNKSTSINLVVKYY